MVEISLSGSGEGLGWETGPGYSTLRTPRANAPRSLRSSLCRSEEQHLLIARIILLGGCWLALLGCSVTTRAPLCLEPGERPPENPFELTIELSSTELAIGESVKVTYHLMNVSDLPVGACPAGWDSFHVINDATKSNRGRVSHSTGVATEDVFRLPPHSTLTWVRAVEMPDVGLGSAQFVGKFESSCWLWSGELLSKAVPIRVVERSARHG